MLDPKHLNAAIEREFYLIPKPEDLIANLLGIFTLDIKEGSWQIKLDIESADKCTFNTPFMSYCFNRLSLGIFWAPEVLQSRNI